MTKDEHNRLKDLVDRWRKAGPELEAVRCADIIATDTIQAIKAFDGLFEEAVKNFPPQPWSGLVEMSRILAKGKRP